MIKEYITSFSEIISNTVISAKSGSVLTDTEAFTGCIQHLREVRTQSGTVYLIGNGGSSGIISHTGIDLLNKGHFKAFPVTDNSLLTCLGNDFGFESTFSQVLQKTSAHVDALIAVSSSGRSPNIINAARWAHEHGLFVITFSGFESSNLLRNIGDINFWLDSHDYGKVEIGHSLLLHILTDALWIN